MRSGDQKGRTVRYAIRYDEELWRLAELSQELVGLGLAVGLRKSLPGLSVSTAIPGVPLYVFVSETGTHFDWSNAAMRHPVDDVAGAARRIAAFLRDQERRTGPGGSATR